MVAEFTERRQLILKLVVCDFIDSANAISSESIVRKYGLPISSATARNEMAALEELGYLTHPHTSAGRIPTDAGYRFFVEHLMEDTPLSTIERDAIRGQFSQIRSESDQWFQLAAAIIARTANNASVVTPPHCYQSRFKHLELILIRDITMLVVLVLHDGTVRQQIMTMPESFAQEDLRTISARINECCYDATVQTIETLLSHESPPTFPTINDLKHQIIDLIVHTMHQIEDFNNKQIHSDGIIEMLSQPEFIPSLTKEDTGRAVARMRQALEILTSGKVLGTLMLRALASNNVQVVIGSEHDTNAMHEYSVVLSRYGVDGTATGVIGIVGPTRMPYPRSISAIRYISSVMSDIVSELYGFESRPLDDDKNQWSIIS